MTDLLDQGAALQEDRPPLAVPQHTEAARA
jgi:hypothetical protein